MNFNDIFIRPDGLSPVATWRDDAPDGEFAIDLALSTSLFNLWTNANVMFCDHPDISATPDAEFREFLLMVASRAFVFDLVLVRAEDGTETPLPLIGTRDFSADCPDCGGVSPEGGVALYMKTDYNVWLKDLYVNEYGTPSQVFDDDLLPLCMDKPYAVPLMRYGNWDKFHEFRDAVNNMAGMGGADYYLNSLVNAGSWENELSLADNFSSTTQFPFDFPPAVNTVVTLMGTLPAMEAGDSVVIRYADSFTRHCGYTDKEMAVFTKTSERQDMNVWTLSEPVRVYNAPDNMRYDVRGGVNSVDIHIDASDVVIQHPRVVRFEIPIVRTIQREPEPVPVSVTAETYEPFDIDSAEAHCGLRVSVENAYVYEAGLCWNDTGVPPTTADICVVCHTDFSEDYENPDVIVSGLADNTEYHIRAYAIYDGGTAYGEEKVFRTAGGGSLRSFSISDTEKVVFSPGNLRWRSVDEWGNPVRHATADGDGEGMWSFSDTEWKCVGADNANRSQSYAGWIDLFGWGTSGYDGKEPYMASTTPQDYGDGGDIFGTLFDWGVYNNIYNPQTGGEDPFGTWHALRREDWQFLFRDRPDADDKWGLGDIDGNKIFILFPDDMEIPAGLSFVPGPAGGNSYTEADWLLLRGVGAICIPLECGVVFANNYYPTPDATSMWTSTSDSPTTGWSRMASATLMESTNTVAMGYSVRLARYV